MDLKTFLKNLKLNESKISTVLGGLIIFIIGIMVVNYFRDLKPQTGSTSSTNTESSEVSNKYKVVKGDTLWSIAEAKLKDPYKWTEIKKVNELTTDKLVEGQELIIPDIAVASTTPTVAAASVTPAPQATMSASASPTPSATPSVVANTKTDTKGDKIEGSSYTVVKGDNLWTIAERTYGDGSKWVEIAKENKLSHPRVIHSGNVLSLPQLSQK